MKSCGATNLITMWLCTIRKWAVIRFSIHASTKPSLMIHQGCQHASWICGQSATVLDSAIVAPLLKTIPPPRNLSSVYLQSPKFSVFYVQKPDLYVKSTNEVKRKIESGFIRHRLKKDLSKHDCKMSKVPKHFYFF